MIEQIKNWIKSNILNPPEMPLLTPTKEALSKLYFKQGNTNVDNGSLSSAIDNYSRAIREDPSNPIFYMVRGICYLAQGQRKCSKDFNKAIELDHNYYEPCQIIIRHINSEPNNMLANCLATAYINKLIEPYIETTNVNKRINYLTLKLMTTIDDTERESILGELDRISPVLAKTEDCLVLLENTKNENLRIAILAELDRRGYQKKDNNDVEN